MDVADDMRCVVCDKLFRTRQKAYGVAEVVVGKPLKQILSLVDATAEERARIDTRLNRLPDDHEVAADHHVCFGCICFVPELAHPSNSKKGRDAARKRSDKTWQLRYEMLKQYKTDNGHANCPETRIASDPNHKLGEWLIKQRMFKRNGTLLPHRAQCLTELGVTWELRDENNEKLWMERYEMLKKYKEDTGHADCPTTHEASDPNYTLGRWLIKQRTYKRNGTLLENHAQLLTELGVTWEPRDENNQKLWMEKYELLKKYKEDNGHADCPRTGNVSDPNYTLGRWLIKQRACKRNGTLLPNRAQLLTELGVTWSILKRKR